MDLCVREQELVFICLCSGIVVFYSCLFHFWQIKGQVLPSEFRSLNQFGYRLRSRRFDGDFHEDAVNGVPEDVLSNREAWNEGQGFAQEYKNKKGRVQERKYGPPKTTLPSLGGQTGDPLLQRPDGTLPTQVDKLRQTVRGNASGSDSEGSSVSSEGASQSALVARELQEKAPTVKSAPVVVPPMALPVFKEDDFPPLSSSESEGPGSPPRPTATTNATKPNDGRQERYDVPRKPGDGPDSFGPQGISTLRASELLRESAAIRGRGRAGALLRHANMPALRLPTEDGPLRGGYENPKQTKAKEFYFPSDDELMAAPEIIPVPKHQISGGTQVRVRQT